MIDIIIIGGGGHARSILSSIIRAKTFNPIGYVDKTENKLMGIDYLGDDFMLDTYIRKTRYAVLGVGQMITPQKRHEIYDAYRMKGFEFPPVISVSAVLSESAKIEEGVFVGENSYIGPNSKIGAMSIINTGALIEHDCSIGSFNHISVNSSLGGGVQTGDNVFIGMGANIVNGIIIGNYSVVGAGSLVMRSIKDNATVWGMPAEKKRGKE